MAAKPTKLPRWATSPDAGGVIEPAETNGDNANGSKDKGWKPGKTPPAPWFNWLLNIIYQWCAYLDDIANQAFTWTLAHIFQRGVTITNSTSNGGLTVTGGANHTGITATGGTGDTNAIVANGVGAGSGLVATGGADAGAGITITGGAGGGTGIYTSSGGRGLYMTAAGPVAEFVATAAYIGVTIVGNYNYGLYVTNAANSEPTARFENTYAGIAGAVYAKSGGNHSTMYVEQTAEGYALFVKKAASGGASTVYLENNNATACLEVNQVSAVTKTAIKVDKGLIEFSGTQPAVGDDPGTDNALHGTNIPKSQGFIQVVGTGASATITIYGGYNITSATLSGSTGVTVTFVRGMADAFYACPLERRDLGVFPRVHSKSTGSFLVKFEDAAALGADADLRDSGVVRSFGFVIGGRQ